MIDYELFRKAKHLKEQEGLTPPQIADALSLDPRTVQKVAFAGSIQAEKGHFAPKQA